MLRKGQRDQRERDQSKCMCSDMAFSSKHCTLGDVFAYDAAKLLQVVPGSHLCNYHQLYRFLQQVIRPQLIPAAQQTDQVSITSQNCLGQQFSEKPNQQLG